MIFSVSHKYKLMVFYSGKCGCTTVKYIMELLDDQNKMIASYEDLKNYNNTNKQIFDNYKKICIIRNPYNKFLSSFFHRLIRGSCTKETYENYIKTLPFDKQTFNGFLENLNEFEDIYKVNNKIIENETHIIPQLSIAYYYFKEQNWNFDIIYDMNYMNDFINYISNLYNLNLKHNINRNKTQSKKSVNKCNPDIGNIHYKLLSIYDYNDDNNKFFFNKKNLKLIRNLYKNDFDQFKIWRFDYNAPDTSTIYHISDTFCDYDFRYIINKNIKYQIFHDENTKYCKLFFTQNSIINSSGLSFIFYNNIIEKFRFNKIKCRFQFKANVNKFNEEFRLKIYTGIKYIKINECITESFKEIILDEYFNFITTSDFRISFENIVEGLELTIKNPILTIL